MNSPVTVAYGGGTNSTALLVERVRRGEPVDLILFADTGGEHPYTYEYVRMFSAWLAERGFPAIITVRYQMANGTTPTLEELCLKNSVLPSKVMGKSACSVKHKIEPQDKYIQQWKPAIEAWARGERVIKLIGYDAEEEYRVKNAELSPVLMNDLFGHNPKKNYRAETQARRYDNQYPLIDWQWTRDECVEAIERAGLPLPGKSSCFFCPSMHAHEIVRLKDTYPELLERALEMERLALPGLTSAKGLGRNFKWADVVAAERDQLDVFKHTIVACLPCTDGGE